MPMTPKEMVRLLVQHGFVKKTRNSSHQKMLNPATGKITIGSHAY